MNGARKVIGLGTCAGPVCAVSADIMISQVENDGAKWIGV